MTINRFWGRPGWREILRQGEGEGGAGGGTGGEAAGGDGGAGGEGTGGDGGTGGEGAGGTGGEAPWWKGDRFNDQTRQMLQAKGLTVDDPVEAIGKLADFYSNAEKRLGKPADQLMDRPKEGQDVAEWLKANGDVFGIPETAEKYDIAKPEAWPKDQPWDEQLEGVARTKAHELGMTQAQMAGMTELFAGHMAKMVGDAETEAGLANTRLQEALQSDWGDQYSAKVAQAQQAASAIAAEAGLDGDAISALSGVLAAKTGDANTIKMFAAIGQMMGDDSAAGMRTGGSTLGVTPADARSELEAMMKPDSDYQKAIKAKRIGQPGHDFDRLHKRYTELSKLAAG
ncbi:hypothetical protein [Palleronia pelagia]|uniref:Uncharacterized protein n=1 Tax=Palleronia pelagia TaxID=387096 RepID=A0A1H8HWN8_9RHOB|nr:hypothetical protein [Palleronia pelagia]SEN60306.1 hypothetical protein SAMN04488011_10522 [Palleronia pelagia]